MATDNRLAHEAGQVWRNVSGRANSMKNRLCRFKQSLRGRNPAGFRG